VETEPLKGHFCSWGSPKESAKEFYFILFFYKMEIHCKTPSTKQATEPNRLDKNQEKRKARQNCMDQGLAWSKQYYNLLKNLKTEDFEEVQGNKGAMFVKVLF